MGKLAVDSLEAGMVLDQDVLDRTGRLLLGAGVVLNQKHMVIFRTWGIEAVSIAGVEAADSFTPLPEDVTQEQLAAAEESLKPLFVNAGLEHPVMQQLLRLAAMRKVQYGGN